MTYRISGLDPAPFAHLYGLPDAALARHGVVRQVVDASPGFPDRVDLRDLDVGETALLLNHVHQPAATPFRASHAIYIREGATTPRVLTGEVPEVMLRRPISLRAFDAAGMMIDADLAEGDAVAATIGRLLADSRAAYLHAHYARPGCFAALVARA